MTPQFLVEIDLKETISPLDVAKTLEDLMKEYVKEKEAEAYAISIVQTDEDTRTIDFLEVLSFKNSQEAEKT